MKLRDYQLELIEKTRQAFREGFKAPIVVLPCGAGKTVMFADMADAHVKLGGYVHFYVHRRELIDQTIETFRKFKIPMDNVYIGMVQRRTPHDIPPTFIIFDEAHHATATLWTNITERYPNVPVVGLTATPKRTNGESLAHVFDTLIEGVDAQWLIDNKYLSDFDYYAPKLTTIRPQDIIIERGTDYDTDAIGDIMLKSKIYGDVAKYLHPDRKTIIYAPSIALSESLEALGVVHLDGNTPQSVRRRVISDFRAGKVMHISNVDLFGEGFDVPDCEVIIQLRPTKSTTLFIQQTMRALRYVPGKRATIYDLVGNVFTHGLPTDYSNWKLDGKVTANYHAAEDITIRMCNKCYRVYSGNAPVCPYCEFDNGKSALEIKQEKDAELVRIENVEKDKLEKIRKDKRREEGMAQTLDELIAIGKKRGYKNPAYWAKRKLKGRKFV